AGTVSWLRSPAMVVDQVALGLYCAIETTPSAMRALMFATTSQFGSGPAEIPFAPYPVSARIGFPVTWCSPAQVMLLLERILAVPAFVPPPDVLMNEKSDMSKFENHWAPLSPPLFGATHGETSMEKRAFGRFVFRAATSCDMYCPAWAAVHG